MRYAIFGDIHANLEALQVVLEDSKKERCTHYCCIGDVVGYNANPTECLEIIKGLDCPVVKGNHDEQASGVDDLEGFNPLASHAIQWTRDQLSEDQKLWLRELKFVRQVGAFTIVHATLDTPHKWGYVFDQLAAAASFSYQTTSLCFFGHTHVPLAFIRDTTVHGGTYDTIKLELGKKYFVNVGSVGQPRDGNPLSAYAIYDTATQTIKLKRLEYDIPKAQEKILAAGLPKRLAERLTQGK
ncbi:MAG: metallophosphoesterase family protein [Verrucomicrobiota bacterium]|nr:metallophosphoesterase family protein [Verrucomicrobiota bacterium]